MGEQFGFAPDPDNPGRHLRPALKTGRFVDIFGAMRVRVEAPDRVRLRVTVTRRHRNVADNAHGGFLLALVDQVYFVGPAMLGLAGAYGGVTIDSTTQFLAPVALGPVDVIAEVLRETERMIFVRGLIEQGGAKAVAFSGTIRRASR